MGQQAESEIEVTEEMVRVGTKILTAFDNRFETPQEAAKDIYRAMFRARTCPDASSLATRQK